jgi:hypothetical protein
MNERTRRVPVAVAGLALLAAAAVSCGSDDGDDDTTASDPTTSASSSSSPSASATPTESPSASASDPASGDPVASPVINKAVKAAIRDGFPALVPAGVPAGWTVVSAAYSPKGGGVWTIELTDPTGASVSLRQSTASSAELVAQLLPDGQPSGPVKVSGTGRWDTYTGSGAVALAKDFSGTGGAVVGPDQDTVVTFVEQLLTAEDAGTSNDG